MLDPERRRTVMDGGLDGRALAAAVQSKERSERLLRSLPAKLGHRRSLSRNGAGSVMGQEQFPSRVTIAQT